MTDLRIHCWRNEYRATADLAGSGPAARAMDRLGPRLAQAFADAIAPIPSLQADGVILLRELALDCDIGIDCPDDQLVRHWSLQCSAAFSRALEDGAALHFPSVAAFEARFLGDLLQGRAWDSWMYRGFEGLRLLPRGAVIRTVLTRPRSSGPAILALLDEGAWPLLLASLPVREALRILSAWRKQAGDQAREADGAPPLAWATSRPVLPGAHAPALLALWLLAAWQDSSVAGAAPAIGAACWSAALLALSEELPGRRLVRLARRANAASLRTLARQCAEPDWLLLLSTSAPEQRRAAAHTVLALRAGAAEAPAPHDPAALEQLDAPCAGLVWLLPALLALINGPFAATLPPAPSGAGADLATLCALALAAGPRGLDAWRDPFWRAYLELEPQAGSAPALLHDWLAAHDPAPAAAVLAALLERQLLGPCVLLRYRVGLERHSVRVERASACPAGSGVGMSLTLAERLSLTRLVRQDHAWLAGSPLAAALPAPWRAVFSTLAHGALRRTANRIPAAARASLPYLFANLLGVPGQAGRSGAPGHAEWALEVRHPPLHVLLCLNGMARLRIDGQDGRRLVLHCAE